MMLIILVKIILIVGLLKYMDIEGNAIVSSGAYAGILFVVGLMLGQPLGPAVLTTIIRFVLASMYFFALYYLDRGFLYWLILVVGLFFLLGV